MSNAGELAALLYEAETTFGEDVNTFATHRIALVAPLNVSGLKHDKIDPKPVIQRMQEGVAWILGTQSGSFTTVVHATGHGSSTAGAITVDPMETWLSYAWGNVLSTAATGDTATGGTATALTTTSSATFTKGGLFRAGAKDDARGNGQAGVVASHIANTLTTLTGFDAGLSAGDVLYPCVNFYMPEDPNDASAAITGLRFEYLSANMRYRMHGCYPTSMKLSGLGAGEVPTWTITWAVARWEYTAAAGAFPSTVTSNRYTPAANAGGSLFLAPVGTATRDGTSKRNYRSLAIDITIGVVPLDGPGGIGTYQKCVGAIRVPGAVKWSWTEDAGAASATPELDGFFTGTVAYHALLLLGPINGKSVALYSPNIVYAGPRPTQQVVNRVNRMSIEAMAYTGTDTTSQLTLSAIRCAYS